MKKPVLHVIFFVCLTLMFTSCAGESAENQGDPAEILRAVLDSVLYKKQSAVADEVLGVGSDEVREQIISLAEPYYMAMDIYTREQCREVSEKIFEKASEITTYRIEKISSDGTAANFKIYFKAVDKDAFYAKYSEISAEVMGGELLSEAEKSIISFDVYMEALDYLTALETEREIEVKLDYSTKKWKVNELPILLKNVFGILISAESE